LTPLLHDLRESEAQARAAMREAREAFDREPSAWRLGTWRGACWWHRFAQYRLETEEHRAPLRRGVEQR
jgi:hypothetical protein